MSHKTPETLVLHMRDAASEACSFVDGLSRSDLDTNRQLQLSLIRCLEIIGEAASRVDESVRSRHPEIPWRTMTAMRNRLIHAYFDVDLDVVWKTVSEELPNLILQLDRMLD